MLFDYCLESVFKNYADYANWSVVFPRVSVACFEKKNGWNGRRVQGLKEYCCGCYVVPDRVPMVFFKNLG